MFFNPFYSTIYALRLHYYTRVGSNARRIHHLYDKLLNRGKSDIIIRSKTNGHKLFCNFAHQLPFYQKEFPLYDRQLSKLCHYIHNELNRTINIIDVGANIGDTVLNIDLKDAFYLCVEGNEEYSKLIRPNLKHHFNYSLEKCYLTDNPNEKKYKADISYGTNKLILSNNPQEGIIIQTLDQLIEKKYNNTYFDIIKIDTDGFDFKVIRGAKKIIHKWNPILYFEWDKAFCKEQGEDPISIFPMLNDLGYTECILFDNLGNLFDIIKTNNLPKLKDCIERTIGYGLPHYYDVLTINKNGDFNIKNIYKLYE